MNPITRTSNRPWDVTGGGNLLLNIGPIPTGEIEGRQVELPNQVGGWLQTYGEEIYGTCGGTYRNGDWGGSCHKGYKHYLHVYDWPKTGQVF